MVIKDYEHEEKGVARVLEALVLYFLWKQTWWITQGSSTTNNTSELDYWTNFVQLILFDVNKKCMSVHEVSDKMWMWHVSTFELSDHIIPHLFVININENYSDVTLSPNITHICDI